MSVPLMIVIGSTITLYTCKNNKYSWNLEDVEVSELPYDWKVEATKQQGPLATWKVIKDNTAPSGKKVLSLTKTNHSSKDTFNLCWTNNISFKNGSIQVHFKAISGKEDKGGGIIWRVQDKNNYYIARFNPLENNLRFYTVQNGVRKLLNNADITLSSGWHSLKISHWDNKISIDVDGQRYINTQNSLFKKSGGIGLWTKADAVTSFSNLVSHYE